MNILVLMNLLISSLSTLFMVGAPGATLANEEITGDGFWVVGNGSYIEKLGETYTIGLYRGEETSAEDYAAELDEIKALLSELGMSADDFHAGEYDADFDYFAMA